MRSTWASFLVLPLQLGVAVSHAQNSLCACGPPLDQVQKQCSQGTVLFQTSSSFSQLGPNEGLVEEAHLLRTLQHASKVSQWKRENDAAHRMLGAMARFEASMLQNLEYGRNATMNATVHANKTAAYNQTINDTLCNDNRTWCRFCFEAEQGLITSLVLARDEHTEAQRLSLALATAAKNHEALSAEFLKHKMELQNINQELKDERITYTASKELFNEVLVAAQRLHPTAVKITKAEKDMNMHKDLENNALEKYNLAAARATAADEFVVANQTKEAMSCADMELLPEPAVQSSIPPGEVHLFSVEEKDKSWGWYWGALDWQQKVSLDENRKLLAWLGGWVYRLDNSSRAVVREKIPKTQHLQGITCNPKKGDVYGPSNPYVHVKSYLKAEDVVSIEDRLEDSQEQNWQYLLEAA